MGHTISGSTTGEDETVPNLFIMLHVVLYWWWYCNIVRRRGVDDEMEVEVEIE